MTLEEAEAAFRAGVALADEEADSGTDLVVLGDISVGGTTAAAVLVAALCGTDASVVTGRGGRGHRRPDVDAQVRRRARRSAPGPARSSATSCSCSRRWAARTWRR